MTLLTRPYMQTANAHLLPIDRNDPTLAAYFPLWYPHGDMTGSTIYSYDWNRLTGTVTGATWVRQGRTFDGSDDKINLGNPAALQITGDISMLAWVKTADANSTIITKFSAGAKGYAVGTTGTGFIRTWFYGTTTGYADGTTDVDDNVWRLVTVTRTGATIKIYLNGVDDNATITGTPAITDSGGNLNIGFDISGILEGHFAGTIGEVMIYNRVLAAAEILNIYTATKGRY